MNLCPTVHIPWPISVKLGTGVYRVLSVIHKVKCVNFGEVKCVNFGELKFVNFGEVKCLNFGELKFILGLILPILSTFSANIGKILHSRYAIIRYNILLHSCRYITVSSSESTVKYYYISALELQIQHNCIQ